MKNLEATLASGTKLTVTPSEFELAMGLFQAIRKASIGMSADAPLRDAIIVSNEAREAFFVCAAKATYGERRVNKQLFDDPEVGQQARQDYFEIFAKVFEANCHDFFGKASSASKGQ